MAKKREKKNDMLLELVAPDPKPLQMEPIYDTPKDLKIKTDMGVDEMVEVLTGRKADAVVPDLVTTRDPGVEKNEQMLMAPPALVPEVVDSEETLVRKALDWVASGKALSEFCTQPGAIPINQMLKMLRTTPELREEWKLAQAMHADALFHDIVRVADYAVDPNKARIMIDARKFVAGRLRPEVYSEKTKADLEVGITINIKKFGE
jgi:hypothetical protein